MSSYPSRHTTLKQLRFNFDSTVNRRCFNVVCLLGYNEDYYDSKTIFRARQTKMYLRTCAQCTDSESYRACAKSYPCKGSQMLHPIVSNDSASGLRSPRSDCAKARADLVLCCTHTPVDVVHIGKKGSVDLVRSCPIFVVDTLKRINIFFQLG